MILSPQTLRAEWNEEGTGDRIGASRCVSLGSGSFISFTGIPTGRVLGMGLCGWGIVLAQARSQLPPSEEERPSSSCTVHTGSLCCLQDGTKRKVLLADPAAWVLYPTL